MGEFSKAAKSGAAKSGGAAVGAVLPYAFLGGIALLALGLIEAKYDVVGKAQVAKAEVDGEITADYAERVYNVDGETFNAYVESGIIRPVTEPDQIADLETSGLNVMTVEEFEAFQNDPGQYMIDYGKAHGWEV